MESIKNYIVAISAAGVIVAVIECIIPHGKISKTVKFAAGLFLVLVIFSPLTTFIRNIDRVNSRKFANQTSFESTQEAYSQQILSEIKNGVINAALQTVNYDENVKVRDAVIQNEKDGNISVKTIVLFNEQQTAANLGQIEKDLKAKFGNNTNIVWQR